MNGLELALLVAGALHYLAGTGVAAATLRSAHPALPKLARAVALLGVLFLTASLVALGARTAHFPVRSAFEAFVFLSLATVALAVALDWLRGLPILTLATLPLGLVTSVLAIALLATPPAEGPPALRPPGVWTALHVVVALGSYGAFALAFVAGLLYLIEQRHLKHHAASAILGLMPALETVSRINVRALGAGVGLLLVGLLVGYFQAREIYERQFNRVDPKIILTTLTFVTYLVILLLSGRPAFKGRRTALASVVSFFLLMANFWASVSWSDIHRFR
jgi:ABC-type transport system involved in cytochrome c biogenesis permease subunit